MPALPNPPPAPKSQPFPPPPPRKKGRKSQIDDLELRIEKLERWRNDLDFRFARARDIMRRPEGDT